MIKTLIIGLGKVSLTNNIKKGSLSLSSHCGSLLTKKNFKIVGAVEKKNNQIKIFKSFYNCECFNSIKTAIKKTQPNLIVISSPTNSHLKIVKEIVFNRSKNLKVILFEKPVGSGLRQINKIKKLFSNLRIKVFVNYSRDYEKAFIRLSNFFPKSSFFEAEVSYSAGFINNASHFISLFINFFGKIKKINVLKKKKINKDFLIKCILNFKNCQLFIKNNNKKNFHSFFIKYNNKVLMSYCNKTESIFSYKKNFFKKINNNLKKGHLNIYNEIEKYFFNKNYYICSLNKAHYVHEVIRRCINL
jgi:hypothetical protein